MSTAGYLQDNISINGQSFGVPTLSFISHSELNPPFTISTDAAGAKCCFMSVWEYDYPPQVIANNLDSPLWIVKETVVQEPYASIYNGQDGQWHTVVTLGNGNYIQMMRSPNDGVGHIHIKCCREDDASLSEIDAAIFENPNQYERPFYCGITVTDGDNSLMGQIVYFGGWTSSDRKYSFTLQRLLANNYNQQFFDGSIAPVYTWSPFEQLSGNNGQFRMNLAQIKAEYIGDGATETVTTDETRFIINSEALISSLITRLPLNEERIVLYCGHHFATAKVTSILSNYLYTYDLKFYFAENLPLFSYTGLMATTGVESYFSFIIDSVNQAAAFDEILKYETLPGVIEYKYNAQPLPTQEQMLDLYVWLSTNGEESEGPYDTGTTDDGGEPGQHRPQDHIQTQPLPTTSGLDVGFLTLYMPTAVQLSAIANYLWSDDVIDNIKKYFGNVSDNILALYSLPFTPEEAPFSGSSLPSKKFKVGNCEKDDLTVKFVNTRYFDVDMGSVQIDKLWGAYLDYAPYTSCEIYLPYLGLHSLDIDELMSAADMNGYMPTEQGCTLSLLYRVDILTGIIVAQLKITNSKITNEIRYQFTGKVGFNIPLTGQTYASLIQGIITSGAGLISTLATSGLTAPMIAGSAAISGTILAQKPNVERIGNISGDASMLSHPTPYIVLSTPNKPELIGQEKFTGFPSYKSGKLSSFSGYTEVLEAHVENIACTEEERSEILTLLKAGVIL